MGALDTARAGRLILRRIRDRLNEQDDTDEVIGLQTADSKSPPDAIRPARA
jgi:hypothetical protein